MKSIEYFYCAHSAFAYLGSKRFREVAQAYGRQIDHRPFDLSRAMQACGSSTFRERTLPHKRHFFGREIERWGEFRGVRLLGRRPTHHDKSSALADCMLIAARQQGGNIDGLAHRILEAHWADDADHADAATLSALAKDEGFDGAALLAAAALPAVRAQYEANTAEAIARNVFGSPTYFVDGDMFYGQDRLELVARACRQPFARR